MAHGLICVGLLLVKEIGVVISKEMPSQEIPEQCHAADGITYLQTHHRQKMGDDVGAPLANGANHTNGLDCTACGACCFGDDDGVGEVVNMDGSGDLCCRGQNSCREITATTRSADCSSGRTRAACRLADITARDTVRCLGPSETCSSAKINFTGTTSPSCLKCEGFSACYAGRVTVDGDKSLQITCSGEVACLLLGVEVHGDTCLQITCSGAGACTGMTVRIRGNGTCYYNFTDGAAPVPARGPCILANETDKCALAEPSHQGPGSCPTPACCAGFGNATADGDCSDINQCEATTTTTMTIATTTTTPTTPTPPYNRNYFRRARRARRRDRRRNRRQYRQ